MGDEERDTLPASTQEETALDVAATVSSVVPWLGGAVSNVLGGISQGRRMRRVAEVLNGLAEELRELRSQVSEQYVRTEDFEELLERTLRQAADERNDEKRRMYRAFLVGAITSPGEPSYDDQVRMLRTLEDLQPDHVRVIRALLLEPDPAVSGGGIGSISQTLQMRLPGMSRELIADLVGQLNDMRLTNVTGLTTMMTARGAQDLRHSITTYGQRFVAFLRD